MVSKQVVIDYINTVQSLRYAICERNLGKPSKLKETMSASTTLEIQYS